MEAVIFPEMLEAGMEALHECEKAQLPAHSIVLAVYMAMSAVYAMRVMAPQSETVH